MLTGPPGGRTGCQSVSASVRRRATTIEIKQAAIAGGMRTLRQDAIGKMLDGVTTAKEVLRVTHPDEV